MHRFFISPQNIEHDQFYITDKKAVKHARQVLRLRKEDRVELFDGNGQVYQGVIDLISKEILQGQILEQEQKHEDRKYLILAQALPRAGKLDDIIRKGIEIGVSQFILFESDYSVAKLNSLSQNKLERLDRLALESARQSERTVVPQISSAQLSELFKLANTTKILLHSRSTEISQDIYKLKSELSPHERVILFIGPEGGFSPKELNEAISSQVNLCYLNLPILRTETAGMVASAILLS